MGKNLMIRRIKDFKHVKPFELFNITLSSGEILHVQTPDQVAFTEVPLGRVAVFDDNGTCQIVRIQDIVSVGH
jgi:hypothetical protein